MAPSPCGLFKVFCIYYKIPKGQALGRRSKDGQDIYII